MSTLRRQSTSSSIEFASSQAWSLAVNEQASWWTKVLMQLAIEWLLFSCVNVIYANVWSITLFWGRCLTNEIWQRIQLAKYFWHEALAVNPVIWQDVPSILLGTVKWVSALRLSNLKWRWWMWTVTAISFWRTSSPSQLAWSQGWQSRRR